MPAVLRCSGFDAIEKSCSEGNFVDAFALARYLPY
jgi:hypothetical protein